jgi:hypothetical protein
VQIVSVSMNEVVTDRVLGLFKEGLLKEASRKEAPGKLKFDEGEQMKEVMIIKERTGTKR